MIPPDAKTSASPSVPTVSPRAPTCDLEAADADALVGLGVGTERRYLERPAALKPGDVRVEPRPIDTSAGRVEATGRVGTMSGAEASVVIATKSGVAIDVAPDERASSGWERWNLARDAIAIPCQRDHVGRAETEADRGAAGARRAGTAWRS